MRHSYNFSDAAASLSKLASAFDKTVLLCHAASCNGLRDRWQLDSVPYLVEVFDSAGLNVALGLDAVSLRPKQTNIRVAHHYLVALAYARILQVSLLEQQHESVLVLEADAYAMSEAAPAAAAAAARELLAKRDGDWQVLRLGYMPFGPMSSGGALGNTAVRKSLEGELSFLQDSACRPQCRCTRVAGSGASLVCRIAHGQGAASHFCDIRTLVATGFHRRVAPLIMTYARALRIDWSRHGGPLNAPPVDVWIPATTAVVHYAVPGLFFQHERRQRG